MTLEIENFRLTAQRRQHVDGVPSDQMWATNCAFHFVINSHMFPNGIKNVKVFLKNGTGDCILSRSISINVKNEGNIAKEVRNAMHKHGTPPLLEPPLDSQQFPSAQLFALPWFMRSNAHEEVDRIAKQAKEATYDISEKLHFFIENGYVVFEKLLPPILTGAIREDLKHYIDSGAHEYTWKGQRVEGLYKSSGAARDVWFHPTIISFLKACYQDEPQPSQTLNFIHGSQQGVHQDTIHLTPLPPHHMNGVWVALEDIHESAGPLQIYPASHRLDRIMMHDVACAKVQNGDWSEFGEKYIPILNKSLEHAGIKPSIYLPKEGDVLIWAESLAHGGTTRLDDTKTRMSMVSHYFAKNGCAFYDSTGMPGITYNQSDFQ